MSQEVNVLYAGVRSAIVSGLISSAPSGLAVITTATSIKNPSETATFSDPPSNAISNTITAEAEAWTHT